jgi:hypothetical protein
MIFRWIILRIGNVSDNSCWENQNTFYVLELFRKTCRLWDNVYKYGSASHATDDRLFTCWITKATHTHSEYLILIAFSLQQCLCDVAQCYVIRELPFFKLNVYTCSKSCPALLETVGLLVSNRNLRDSAMLNVVFKRCNCPSARCAVSANVISMDSLVLYWMAGLFWLTIC